jgi:hypothetical protein
VSGKNHLNATRITRSNPAHAATPKLESRLPVRQTRIVARTGKNRTEDP